MDDVTVTAVVPRWWVVMRDALMLVVGLGGILWQHLNAENASGLLVVTDLVLIGLIPLGHVALRFPRPIVALDRSPTIAPDAPPPNLRPGTPAQPR